MNEHEFFVYNHDVRNFGEHKREYLGPSYVALAMALRYQGVEATPRMLFEKAHGENAVVEDAPAPTFTHLAAIAQDLSAGALFPLKATAWDEVKYEKLRQKSSRYTPFDVMDEYLFGRNAPCIIRAQRQPWLVVGVEPITRSYKMYNPLNDVTALYKKVWFDRWWSRSEQCYPEDLPGAAYPMLTVEKDKRKISLT
jgi:hypothetical protein